MASHPAEGTHHEEEAVTTPRSPPSSLARGVDASTTQPPASDEHTVTVAPPNVSAAVETEQPFLPLPQFAAFLGAASPKKDGTPFAQQQQRRHGASSSLTPEALPNGSKSRPSPLPAKEQVGAQQQAVVNEAQPGDVVVATEGTFVVSGVVVNGEGYPSEGVPPSTPAHATHAKSMSWDSRQRSLELPPAYPATSNVLLTPLAGEELREPTQDAEGHNPATLQLRDRARHLFLSSSSVFARSRTMDTALHESVTSKGTTTASSLRYDSAILRIPFQDTRRTASRHKGQTFYVRQATGPKGQCCFDTTFLAVRVNDTVEFSWYDQAHHIFETDGTYARVIPGGRHSIQLSHSQNEEDEDVDEPGGLRPEKVDEEAGYMSFTTTFTHPGNFYFVCSRNKRRMRLQVQVLSDRSHFCLCWSTWAICAIIVLALIAVVILTLTYWLQKKDLFVKEGSLPEKQYEAIHELQDILTTRLFPFLTTGVLVILVVIIAAVGYGLRFCFLHSPKQGSHHRGVPDSLRAFLVTSTMVFCVLNVALLFAVYGVQLQVTDGINNFAQQLASGLISTLNAFSTTLSQVQWLVTTAPTLFPDVDLPLDDINGLIGDVGGILNGVEHWAALGEDVVQGVFRLLPVLLFLTIQLGLFACAMAVVSLFMRFRHPVSKVAWILAVCIGLYACGCGVVWSVSKLLDELYSSAVILKDAPQNLPNQWGMDEDNVVSRLLSACSLQNFNTDIIGSVVQDILVDINATLDAEGQKEFGAVFNTVMSWVPDSFDTLANYSVYITLNLDTLQGIIDARPDEFDDLFKTNIVPFLQVLLNSIQTLYGLVECTIFREIVANAIPVLKNQVQTYNTVLEALMFVVLGLGVPTLLSSIFVSYALKHPRKTWYEARTGRWFRFRYSYKVHHQLVMKTPQEETESRIWVIQLRHHSQPFMSRLFTTRLVCFVASMLMFFDSILLALFTNLARTIAKTPLLRVVTYLGCAQLLFLLAASLSRRVWLRRLFHSVALTIVLGVFGVSLAQALHGFIKFGTCFADSDFQSIGNGPYLLDCPVTFAGHQLEVAVYATVMVLNSITILVTLILLLCYEEHFKAEMEKRHYVGILSCLENCCGGCFRRLFQDTLKVQRMYTVLFSFIVLLFLCLVAVVDISNFHVVGGKTPYSDMTKSIVQVIDPTVGCNGDSGFCNMRLNEYMFLCAHNAYSSSEDGFVGPNHYYNISRQLYAGVRAFMLDLYYDKVNSSASDETDIYLCHTLCLIGRRRFRLIAELYKEFLDTYEEQILLINFEQYVNSSDIGAIFDEVGLTKYVWYNTQPTPSTNPDYVWPTLRELINSGQRLLVFNDVKANRVQSVGCPDWLYYAYNFQFENFYDTFNVADWSCKIERGWCDGPEPVNENDTEVMGPDTDYTNCSTSRSSPWNISSNEYNLKYNRNPPHVMNKLSTINHMITLGVGSPVEATRANVPISVQSATLNCSTRWNAVVNLFAVDFWTVANPLATVHAMNKNLARYGKRYDFKDEWQTLLFGAPDYINSSVFLPEYQQLVPVADGDDRTDEEEEEESSEYSSHNSERGEEGSDAPERWTFPTRFG